MSKKQDEAQLKTIIEMPKAHAEEKTAAELRTLLVDVWQNTVSPHEMKKHRLSEKTVIEPDVTIVSAETMPEAALDPTLVPPGNPAGLSKAARTGAKTLSISLDTKKPQRPEEMAQTMVVKPDATAVNQSGGDATIIFDKTSSQKGRASTIAEAPPAGATSGTSAAYRSATAGALVKAAQDLASASLSKMIVQQKTVVHAALAEAAPIENPDYEIRRQLGEGGMGVVYSARQTSIDREIALKMIKPGVAMDKDIQTVFLAEAAVTGELEHPNIIPIYELGVQENGVLFYSMKQAKGIEWKGIISQKSQEENIAILLKVADAVAFAHSKGIIHRDLKPENIMLGEFGEVLVMDWGLAASVVEGGKIGKISKTTAAGGTPAYMAPEMCTGQVELIGYQSDVYLLGAILYEIVTGKRPHYADNMMDLLYNVATNKIEPTDKKSELVKIALRAMATHPKNRYPDVMSLQQAIRDTQKHYESITMSNEAAERLKLALKSNEYETFAHALFGFQEALRIWDKNAAAQSGVIETRVAYAQCAIEKEDLDLAVSLLEPVRAKFPDLSHEITRRVASRDARQFRMKALTIGSLGLVAMFLIGLTVAYFLVEGKRKEAEVANERAQEEKAIAVKQTGIAEHQTKLAVEQQKRAEEERERVVKAQKEIVRQKEIAEEQTRQALAAKKDAEEQKSIADKQREQALAAKQEADAQRANAVKQKEQAELARKEALTQKSIAEEQTTQAVAAKKEAEEQRLKALEQKQIAENSLAELSKIGGLKKRIAQSLPVEEAQALQAQATREMKEDVFKSIPVGAGALELALAPAGEFVMGSDIEEPYRSAEEYLHTVKLNQAFYIGRYEVTQGQWFAVTGQQPRKDFDVARDGRFPMVDVSYDQVVSEFLPQLQRFAPKGYTFRLPTEAEWEYACRAGSYKMFCGGAEESLDDYAWFQDNSNKELHEVGKKTANAWGLYDMHGNASELCMDVHDLRYYLNPIKDDPVNQEGGKYRVVRGGSWINLLQHCRSAYRSYVHPGNKYDHLGIRVAMVRN